MGQKNIKPIEADKVDQAEATEETKKTKPAKTSQKMGEAKKRSKKYKKLVAQIDREKDYPVDQAVDLLLEIAKSKIDETVELHFVVKEKISGQVSLPHGTGKTQKVEIADEKTLKKLDKGQIDFDLLVAAPVMMPKLAKYAKLLGPKGLMPNPKTNTISEKPADLVKNMAKGETFYKTEAKADLLHLIVGKISFGAEKLIENIQAVLKDIRPGLIKKIVLTSTHTPGIKLEVKKN